MFFLLHKHTDDGVFDDFPKIFQNCSKDQTSVPEHFPRISEKFPKLSEDFRRLPKIFEEDPKIFR